MDGCWVGYRDVRNDVHCSQKNFHDCWPPKHILLNSHTTFPYFLVLSVAIAVLSLAVSVKVVVCAFSCTHAIYMTLLVK